MADQSRDENLVCISATFHTAATFPAFYEANCDRLGGFTGIHGVVIEMADLLTAAEAAHPVDEGDFYDARDWISLIDHYVQAVHGGESPKEALTIAIDSSFIDWNEEARP